jgi:D-3-phosphoglycerate dehydrogenase
MHAGHWDKATHKSVELNGRTIGLVGLGAIGLRFARMADAMGMRVLGHRPVCAGTCRPVCSRWTWTTVWRESDAISLHCPLTADNRHLLNAQTLAACKRGVIVVNTARGGLIDEPRCCRPSAARARWPAAGLDSFAVEPMTVPHPSTTSRASS